jgi:hypothetical protein
MGAEAKTDRDSSKALRNAFCGTVLNAKQIRPAGQPILRRLLCDNRFQILIDKKEGLLASGCLGYNAGGLKF